MPPIILSVDCVIGEFCIYHGVKNVKNSEEKRSEKSEMFSLTHFPGSLSSFTSNSLKNQWKPMNFLEYWETEKKSQGKVNKMWNQRKQKRCHRELKRRKSGKSRKFTKQSSNVAELVNFWRLDDERCGSMYARTPYLCNQIYPIYLTKVK